MLPYVKAMFINREPINLKEGWENEKAQDIGYGIGISGRDSFSAGGSLWAAIGFGGSLALSVLVGR